MKKIGLMNKPLFRCPERGWLFSFSFEADVRLLGASAAKTPPLDAGDGVGSVGGATPAGREPRGIYDVFFSLLLLI